MSDQSAIPLTPCLLTGAALSLLGIDIGLPVSRGATAPIVRQMLTRVGLSSRAPWGMAYVTHMGYRSHQLEGYGWSSWPLPLTGDPNELAEFAREQKIADAVPRIGDVALIWSPSLGRFAQAGVVTWTMDFFRPRPGWAIPVRTIEGNVYPGGGPGGPGVDLVRRNIICGAGTIFVRWVLLDGRRMVSDPTRARDIVPSSHCLDSGRILQCA